MPEHVDVYWEGRIGGLSGTFNHSPDSHAAVQRVTALARVLQHWVEVACGALIDSRLLL